jgi:hypothetical protein
MSLIRVPQPEWLRGAPAWSTQFDDLRDSASLCQPGQNRIQTLRRELKQQALFDHQTVVRDSDLVNNVELLELMLDDTDRIRTTLAEGVHLLSIRSTAATFTEVNEQAAKRRAHPSRYEAVKPLLARVDPLLTEHEIPIAEVERPRGAGGFSRHLRRIADSQHISGREREVLFDALPQVEPGEPNEPLRFGDLYDLLVRNKQMSPSDNLIRWIRAAHILTIPVELGLPPSTSDRDLSPSQVAFLVGHGEEAAVDMSQWMDLFPRRILTDVAIDQLTFPDIMRLRSIGKRLGYFDAVSAAHNAYGTPMVGRAMVAYLKVLEEYLKAMALETKIELTDWQRVLASGDVQRRDMYEKWWFCGVPTILTFGIGAIITQSPLPFAFAGFALGNFAKETHSWIRAHKPLPMSELLAGCTLTPALRRAAM